MTQLQRVLAAGAAWVVAVSAAHLALNVDWSSFANDRRPRGERKLNVAYIPVT